MKDYFKIGIHNLCFVLIKLVIILLSKDTNLKLHPTPGTLHEPYCINLWSLKRQNLGEKWWNLSNQHSKGVVELKINIKRRQWACFIHVSCGPTCLSTQKNDLINIMISLCQINICGERWASPQEARTENIRKDVSRPSKPAETSQKFAKSNPTKNHLSIWHLGHKLWLVCASSNHQTHLMERVITQIRHEHTCTKYQLYPN